MFGRPISLASEQMSDGESAVAELAAQQFAYSGTRFGAGGINLEHVGKVLRKPARTIE